MVLARSMNEIPVGALKMEEDVDICDMALGDLGDLEGDLGDLGDLGEFDDDLDEFFLLLLPL